jgi:hypothetical protein
LLVAFVAGAYLAGTVIVWLRRWGAYIERRLTEIEARLVNSRPAYYIGGDLESIEPNPLFEKLDRIERFVERISKL